MGEHEKQEPGSKSDSYLKEVGIGIVEDKLGNRYWVKPGEAIPFNCKTGKIELPEYRRYKYLGMVTNTPTRPMNEAIREEWENRNMNEFHVSYFDTVLNKIKEMHSKKASDYTDSREFGNFEDSAKHAGITVAQSIEVLIGTKEARRQNLENGIKQPINESIEDTLLDRAVYSIIRLAHYMSEKDKNQSNHYGPERYGGPTFDEMKHGLHPGLECGACKHPQLYHKGQGQEETGHYIGCSCCKSGTYKTPLQANNDEYIVADITHFNLGQQKNDRNTSKRTREP